MFSPQKACGTTHSEVPKVRAGGSRKKRELKLEQPIPCEMQQRQKRLQPGFVIHQRSAAHPPWTEERDLEQWGRRQSHISAVPSWKVQRGHGASTATSPLLGRTLHTAEWQPKPKNILLVKQPTGASHIPVQQEICCDSWSLIELGVSLLNRGCHHRICSMTASSQIPWGNQAFS